ncbi:MAG: hypothetical protein IAE88_09510 [Rhodobacteraceae bacterium]|nr:hypothetical protein [Paracoccaceae bacterium]
MTVIALLNHPETPILLSDMLFSDDKEGDKSSIYLPALGNLNAVAAKLGLELPYKATRMARKPFMVGNRSIVAWAGYKSAGNALMAFLQENCAGRHVTQEDIDSAFWNIPEAKKEGFSVICVSIPAEATECNWREKLVISSRGCICFESKLYGRCFFGGKGAVSLKEFVRSRDELYAKVHGKDTAALLATSLCGSLVFRETLLNGDLKKGQALTASRLLLDASGGFFEAYMFQPQRVLPPRSVLYIHAEVRPRIAEPLLTRIYYYSSRNQNGLVLSFLSQHPQELSESEALILDDMIDGICCQPFYEEVAHMHVRSKAIDLLHEGEISIDAVSVTLFETNTQLPRAVLAQMEELERIEAECESRFRHQQFSCNNESYDPLVKLSLDENHRLMLSVNHEWMRDILHRFAKASTTADCFVGTDATDL